MAHNAYIRGGVGSGHWATVVSPGDFELFDLRQFQSVNGDLGGTWAPANLIEIGGAGVKITATFQVVGTTFLNGLIVEGSSLFRDATFVNAVEFQDNVTIDSGATFTFVSGSTLVQNGNISGTTGHYISGYIGQIDSGALLKVVGIQSFESTSEQQFQSGSVQRFALDAGSAYNAGSTLQMDATSTLAGAPTMTAVLIGSGAGRYRRRPAVAGADTNTTYSIGSGDVILVPALSADRVYTISTTGADNGDTMLISLRRVTPNTHFVLVKDGGGNTLANLKDGDALYPGWVELMMVSGQWAPIAQGTTQ